MKKVLAISITVIFFITGCTENEQQGSSNNPEDKQTEELSLSIDNLEVIAESLDVPWSIEGIHKE
ncbi:PBP1b-binding outer membrane lipoprotein LpoB [Virgibacillus halotolerans]|uniref:hypothetical protein n=1 Tax=Virgibacillus halotolerans TaxID=1071053 RepID=UPI00195F59AA|nr:hypothetical protein [Virgibacillus halotolerans]MBM7601447.1 PBP1b-binding outer membrane lipoprotein LpoB [Virgibacillus halotolerans]